LREVVVRCTGKLLNLLGKQSVRLVERRQRATIGMRTCSGSTGASVS
jgi:hypothetical protein